MKLKLLKTIVLLVMVLYFFSCFETAEFDDMDLFGENYTPITKAIWHGKLSKFKRLINKETDLNRKTPRGHLIHTVIEYGSGFLLNGPGDWDDRERTYNEMVAYLVKKRIDLNLTGRRGLAPLHIWCQIGKDVEIARLFIKYGADINAKDQAGRTPLHHSVYNAHDAQLYECLMENGADIHDVDKLGRTVLHIAGCGGNLLGIKFFMEKGVDIHARDMYHATALHYAAIYKNTETIELLMNLGLKKDPIIKAILNENYEIKSLPREEKKLVRIRFFSYRGRSIVNLIHHAVQTENVDLARLLIANGVDLDAKTSREETPLHIAVEKNNVEFVTLLLEAGANANIKNGRGDTPLDDSKHYSDKRSPRIIELLKQYSDKQ